jgi:hypothetical protein
LGVPVGEDTFINSHLNSRLVKTSKVLAALPHLEDPQIAICILTKCNALARANFESRNVDPSFGGGGIRSAVDHRLAGFLGAGLRLAKALVSILPRTYVVPSNLKFELEFKEVLAGTDTIVPTFDSASQKCLSRAINSHLLTSLLKDSGNAAKARVLSCGLKGSGAFVSANPSRSKFLSLLPREFLICFTLRLGLDVLVESICPGCTGT